MGASLKIYNSTSKIQLRHRHVQDLKVNFSLSMKSRVKSVGVMWIIKYMEKVRIRI